MAPDLEGKLGKLRRLVNEQVVDRLKDDEARSGIIDQIKDHAGEIAGAGSAIMSRLSSSDDKSERVPDDQGGDAGHTEDDPEPTD